MTGSSGANGFADLDNCVQLRPSSAGHAFLQTGLSLSLSTTKPGQSLTDKRGQVSMWLSSSLETPVQQSAKVSMVCDPQDPGWLWDASAQ